MMVRRLHGYRGEVGSIPGDAFFPFSGISLQITCVLGFFEFSGGTLAHPKRSNGLSHRFDHTSPKTFDVNPYAFSLWEDSYSRWSWDQLSVIFPTSVTLESEIAFQ